MSDHNNQFQNPRLGVNFGVGTGAVSMGISATVLLSNGGGVVWGMQTSGASLVVTASAGITAAIQSISAGTTQITSGQAIFSNSGGVSFGISGQTLTAQLPPISYWDNRRWDAQALVQISFDFPYFQRVSLGLPINVTRIDFQAGLAGFGSFESCPVSWVIQPGEYLVGINSTSGTTGQLMVGIYSFSHSTASLLSTGSRAVGGVGGLLGQAAPDVFGGISAVGGGDFTAYWGNGAYSGGFLSVFPQSLNISDINQTINDPNNPGMPIPYMQFAGTF